MYDFQIEDLVSNDKLNVVSEEEVFVAVMDWIKHNPTERSQYIAQVNIDRYKSRELSIHSIITDFNWFTVLLLK